ncbi:MAG: hypothetical protein KIT87_21665 [Anaerolineae bacterium]|nr:hypothetical protein [Anaerolineae bacterium]
MSAPTSLRVVAVLLWFFALGFGVPCLLAIRSLSAGRGIPLVMGFPAYGGGPFEQHGLPTTIPLVLGFLLVCILEAVAGWLLWGGYRAGAILALALVVPGGAYWWGFDLPIPPIVAIVRTILIMVNWSRLI